LDIKYLQTLVGEWSQGNFGDAPSHLALIKVQEELGELAQHFIGRIEHRIGSKRVDHQEGLQDSVADIVIALCVFCYREGIDLNEEIEKVWAEVSERTFDFQKG
jgi:NTP pyrophosphatase (non-canonical NTP hydrolase)